MSQRRAQSSVKWVLGLAILIGVAVAIVVVGFRWSRPKVVVTDAVEGPVVQAFYSTGTVQPVRDYPIKSNIAAVITEVKVDKGDRVTAGQVLAVVADPELVYAARKAEAELKERQQRADAKTSPVIREIDARIMALQSLLEISQREEQRLRKLIETSAASQRDLDTAINRLKTIWSDLEANKALRVSKQFELDRELAVAQSALDTAKWNLDQQTLKSPIDGAVLDRPLSVGTRVAINDQLMTVADITPSKLVMRAAVDEEDIIKVRKDQTVRMTLYSYSDRGFEGRVQKIYDQADPERRTFEVDVQILQPDDRLSPGMTGELAFEMGSRERAVVIPSQAVQKGGGVFIVAKGKLERAVVEIGLRGIERTEVKSGMKNGDKVVISAIGDLEPGKRVRTEYVDPVTAAGVNKPKVVSDSFKGFK